MTYTSKDGREFDLQVLRGKTYELVGRGERRDLETAFERMAGEARRLVVTAKARPARPKYARSGRGAETRSKYARAVLIGRYFDWAKAAGLKRVHVYEGDGYLSHVQGMECVPVPLSDFLGDAPEAEMEDIR